LESHLIDFLAASAIAYFFSLPLDLILDKAKSLKPLPRRGVLLSLKGNVKLFDESYNSNPVALEEVLKGLSGFPAKRKVAVLGDMLELGEKEIAYHVQAGKQVVQCGWDTLVTVGPLSRHMAEAALASGMKKDQIYSYRDSTEAADFIQNIVQDGDFILVKGSRGIQTEIIVEKLKSRGT